MYDGETIIECLYFPEIFEKGIGLSVIVEFWYDLRIDCISGNSEYWWFPISQESSAVFLPFKNFLFINSKFLVWELY